MSRLNYNDVMSSNVLETLGRVLTADPSVLHIGHVFNFKGYNLSIFMGRSFDECVYCAHFKDGSLVFLTPYIDSHKIHCIHWDSQIQPMKQFITDYFFLKSGCV